MHPILKLELTAIRYLALIAEALTSIENRNRSQVPLDLISKINDHIEHLAQQSLEYESEADRRSGLEPSIALLSYILDEANLVHSLFHTRKNIPTIEQVKSLQDELLDGELATLNGISIEEFRQRRVPGGLSSDKDNA